MDFSLIIDPYEYKTWSLVSKSCKAIANRLLIQLIKTQCPRPFCDHVGQCSLVGQTIEIRFGPWFIECSGTRDSKYGYFRIIPTRAKCGQVFDFYFKPYENVWRPFGKQDFLFRGTIDRFVKFTEDKWVLDRFYQRVAMINRDWPLYSFHIRAKHWIKNKKF